MRSSIISSHIILLRVKNQEELYGWARSKHREMKNLYSILVLEPERKRPLG
jgi:hypothetical protein